MNENEMDFDGYFEEEVTRVMVEHGLTYDDAVCNLTCGVVEEWKAFHNVEISNLGNVKTVRNKGNGYTGNRSADGYKSVFVSIDGDYKKFFVHRLVCHLFNGFDLASPLQINHINHDRSDNRLSNLEAVDRFENQQKRKSYKNGRLFGTRFEPRSPKTHWEARISISGKMIYLGLYETEQIAHTIAVLNYTQHYGKPPYCECLLCNQKKSE